MFAWQGFYLALRPCSPPSRAANRTSFLKSLPLDCQLNATGGNKMGVLLIRIFGSHGFRQVKGANETSLPPRFASFSRLQGTTRPLCRDCYQVCPRCDVGTCCVSILLRTQKCLFNLFFLFIQSVHRQPRPPIRLPPCNPSLSKMTSSTFLSRFTIATKHTLLPRVARRLSVFAFFLPYP